MGCFPLSLSGCMKEKNKITFIDGKVPQNNIKYCDNEAPQTGVFKND